MRAALEAPALAEWIAGQAGAERVRIEAIERLTGGAIRENWGFEAVVDGGAVAGRHALVLRSAGASAVPESRPLDQEYALLRAAHGAGVTVPEPLWFGPADVMGQPFYVMRRVAGTAVGARLVRNADLDGATLAQRLGRELAAIHTIVPPRDDLPFLGLPSASPALDAVALYCGYLDDRATAHPALEWGLRWLELNAPPKGEVVLVHHDFRTGNYMVDETGLTGILDWEFAGWSDPLEDVGWFCAKCWRFGAWEREAGGIADRAPFYAGYEAASGRALDADAVHYWEVMAHLRWAVIALQQGDRHLSGAQPSLELALVGRRPAELEAEILALTGAS